MRTDPVARAWQLGLACTGMACAVVGLAAWCAGRTAAADALLFLGCLLAGAAGEITTYRQETDRDAD